MKTTLIVGLGNPGEDYARTFHNAGFMSADQLAGMLKADGFKAKRTVRAHMTETRVAGGRVIIIKPQTFMNNSGEAVKYFMDYYKIDPANLIVIYDDIDLKLGSIRIREKGGPGTHNGMRSIDEHIKTQDFARVRVGIGPLPAYFDIMRYVLSNPNGIDEIDLKLGVKHAAEAVEMILKSGVEAAQRKYNEK